MDGCQQHDLLLGIQPLHVVERLVDASPIGRVAHHGVAMLAVHHVLGFVDTRHHLFLALRKPLADGHTRIVVVGADEDHDGIDAVAMLRLQLISLARDIIPLAPALAIHTGRYLEPLLQIVPVFQCRSVVVRIRNGVAEIGHPLPFPGMVNQSLCHSRHHD